MSANNERLFLFDVSTHEQVAEIEYDNLDVYFPAGVHGWSDVLDCRPEPYDAKSVDENCEFAHHVAKKYILVPESSLDAHDS